MEKLDRISYMATYILVMLVVSVGIHAAVSDISNRMETTHVHNPDFEMITDDLYYDRDTFSVWLYCTSYPVNKTIWSPYCTENGIPLLYNPDTGCLEFNDGGDRVPCGSASLYGTDNFKGISGKLQYDTMTGIVWVRNYSYGVGKYVWVPYYAGNGLPYRYDPVDGKQVEIKHGDFVQE